MQILKGLSYANSDYVHDDEIVHIQDSVTGKVYEIYLRRPEASDNGNLCLVIPRSICRNLVTKEQIIIIELGEVHS
jgi:hypothetical protein